MIEVQITYKYIVHFNQKIDIFDVLLPAYCEKHVYFNVIDSNYTNIKKGVDYITITHIKHPSYYMKDDKNKKVYENFNYKASSYNDDTIDYYNKILESSKLRLSPEKYNKDEYKESIEISEKLCNLMELNDEDKNNLDKILSSEILAPYIHKHGFMIERTVI